METVLGWSALYEDFCDSSINFSSIKILTVWDFSVVKKKKKIEYWSGLPFPSPDLDLPDPGIKPDSPIL